MGHFVDQLKLECKKRSLNYVDYRGFPSAPVWIVGEAPGAEEDQNGVPFCGSSGKELDRMVSEAGLRPNDVCYTNPYRVRPPDNDLSRLVEKGIPLELYKNAFWEELKFYRPTIIVPTGATPLGILCPQVRSKKDGEAKISLWRGSLLTSPELSHSHYVIPSYHPAFVLREWSERSTVVFCLSRAREEFDFFRQHGCLNPLPKRQLITQPPADDVIDYLTEVLDLPRSQRVSNDIEMIRRRIPYTIAIAKSPADAISFSLWNYELEKLKKIWRLLDRVLRERPTIGQNYIGFDIPWLEVIGLRPNPFAVSDTLIRHHTLWVELSHKLEFQTIQYTREPYYKDEGKTWTIKDGLGPLQLYNAKDAAVTYEVWQGQEEEFDERPHLRVYAEEVKTRRQALLHKVSHKGILFDPDRLASLSKFIDSEVNKECDAISKLLNQATFPVADAIPKGIDPKLVWNLSAPHQVIQILKQLGLKVPHDRLTGKPTTAEPKLQKLLASTNHPFLVSLLNVREYNKIKTTYIECPKVADITDPYYRELFESNVFYSSYGVTKTVTDRLGSSANFFGLGGNGQNIPKHSKLGKRFRECLIARPGHIILECDQEQAEDWVVQAIIADNGGGTVGLDELKSGVDRHKKLASFLFSKPEDQCDRGTIERYLGKKCRHAGNYDMKEFTMSEALAKEGFVTTMEMCAFLLYKFHQFCPEIQGVFHAYIQHELMNKQLLRSPLGPERYFLSLRSYSDNSAIFRDGYAYIPQSTVATNTGLAELFLEDNGFGDCIVADGHDAIFLELEDNDEVVLNACNALQTAFDREITFPNYTTIKIPIKVGFGYNFKNITECDSLQETGLKNTLTLSRRQRNHQLAITSGPELVSSQLR